MKKSEVCQKVFELASPIAAANGCEIYDIEFVKEGSDYFLRVYIDMADHDKNVSLDECEAVSRALSDALDADDPTDAAYMLEVSSAGIDRALKTKEHFERFIGEDIDIGLYKAVNGTKVICGTLKKYENDIITITKDNGEDFEISRKETAFVKLTVKF